MTRRDEPARSANAGRDADALSRVAATASALSGTSDLAALVDVCGEAAREATRGYGWRFLALDPENGTLHDGSLEGPVVLPAPGGAVEWLLLHEALVLRAAVPADGLGGPLRSAVLGLPIRSGGVLRGLLLVGLDQPPPAGPADPGVVAARVVAEQCALALERHALGSELARQRERMQRLEVRAHAGEELFSDLISVVAHEIRTPLTSIKAYTETLIDAPADEFDRRRDFLHVIDEECDRLARLVGDALDLSRLEAGLRLLKVKPVSPRALLDDVVLTIGPDAQRHGLTLRVEAQGAPDEVEADGDLVKQLLLNLVGNAIKFSPAGTTVTLRAEAGAGGGVAGDAGDWRIAVIDQGGGIPEDQIERIFERFYRIETKDGRRAPGTGLGLAIARHIVDLHGGHLGVENGATGGSVFTVRLPRRQLAPAPVRDVARDLVARPEALDLLDAAVGMISEVMESEIVSVLLVDPAAGDLFVAAAVGLDGTARARRMHFRSGVAGAVLSAGRPVLVENIETDRRFGKKNHPQYSTKSLLCAPLQAGGVNVGTVNVNNKRSREEFDEGDLALLTSLATRLSAVLSRALAYPEAPGVFAEARASVQSAARVRGDLWLGPEELSRHARRVARQLGLDGATAGTIAHLASAEGASPWGGDGEERARARSFLLARGERLDGSGWPRGLSGADVPLGARILGVIDAFSGMTHGRPYRASLTVDEAIAALREGAGRLWDEAVIEAFAASLAADGWATAADDACEEAA
jgi:signal transduction histidine kinase/putative methionine-R-sulfoxide reductase with GAF domain